MSQRQSGGAVNQVLRSGIHGRSLPSAAGATVAEMDHRDQADKHRAE